MLLVHKGQLSFGPYSLQKIRHSAEVWPCTPLFLFNHLSLWMIQNYIRSTVLQTRQRTEEHCYGVYVHPCTNSFSREKIFCPFDKSHLLWSSWQGAAQQTHTVVYRTTVCSINTRIFLYFFKFMTKKSLDLLKISHVEFGCAIPCAGLNSSVFTVTTQAQNKQTSKQHLTSQLGWILLRWRIPIQCKIQTGLTIARI